MNSILNQFVDLIFPRFCGHCECSLRGDQNPSFCRDCWSSIQFLKGPVCPSCGTPFRSSSALLYSPTHRCGECRRRKPTFNQAVSATRYEGVLKEAIHRFKYHQQANLAQAFADLILEQVNLEFKIDYLIPVPLHARRLKERQYNQALLLSDALGKRIQFKVIPDGLERIRETTPQAGLPMGQRRRNVRGAFCVRQPSLIKNQRILLVDDVMTTGATANECAKTLKKAGAKSISVLTIARAVSS